MSSLIWSNMADVASQPVRWLWDGRIARGKLTVLNGEPGIGKSTLALDLAAKVSRGEAMPLSKAAANLAGNVVIFSGDDDLADTVRPRLEAAGADLKRIRPIAQEIHKADVDDLKPALIVIDPLSSYICLTCEPSAREVIQNLARLADET